MTIGPPAVNTPDGVKPSIRVSKNKFTDGYTDEELAALTRPYGEAIFWSKGYVGTSPDDLLEAISIGFAGHCDRLRSALSPLAVTENLLLGLFLPDDDTRLPGYMGVGSIEEVWHGGGPIELGAQIAFHR